MDEFKKPRPPPVRTLDPENFKQHLADFLEDTLKLKLLMNYMQYLDEVCKRDAVKIRDKTNPDNIADFMEKLVGLEYELMKAQVELVGKYEHLVSILKEQEKKVNEMRAEYQREKEREQAILKAIEEAQQKLEQEKKQEEEAAAAAAAGQSGRGRRGGRDRPGCKGKARRSHAQRTKK